MPVGSWDKPVDRACPTCENPLLFEKSSRSGPTTLYCRVCKSELEAAPDEAQEEPAAELVAE